MSILCVSSVPSIRQSDNAVVAKTNYDTQAFVIRHEFRHLMRANSVLDSSVGYLGAYLSGKSNQTKTDIDADAWANRFKNSVCGCGD